MGVGGPGGGGRGPGRWGRSELNRIKATLASHPSTKNQMTPGLEGTSVGRKLRHGVGGNAVGLARLHLPRQYSSCGRRSNSPCVFSLPDSSYLDGVSLPDFELLSDPEDEHLCANLMQLLQESLSQARLGSRRPARLLMPSQLVSQVGKELLRLAYSEPCGLRGALLDVCVEQGKSCHSVAQLALDPSLVPTFQLTLVLRLDSRLWPKIQGLLSSANSSLVPGYSQSLTLSTGFRVIKKKLYSSEQLLIEEC